MKTQRFLHSALSDKVVIRNFVRFIFVRFILIFVACSFMMTGHAQTTVPKDVEVPAFASDLEELLTTVYCHCGCVRETIKACVCGTALAIEASFKDELTKGKSVDQIRTAYLEKYGSQFYAVMPAEGINLLAYIMPGVIFVVIGGVVFVVFRSTRSMRGSSVTSGAQAESESQVSDDAVKQIEAELERYKRGN